VCGPSWPGWKTEAGWPDGPADKRVMPATATAAKTAKTATESRGLARARPSSPAPCRDLAPAVPRAFGVLPANFYPTDVAGTSRREERLTHLHVLCIIHLNLRADNMTHRESA